MKRLASAAFLLAAQVGVSACLQSSPRAPHVDVGPLLHDAATADELTAWVIETYNDPTKLPPPRTAPPGLAGWSVEPSWSVANRNNNPLNIKLGSETRWYVEAGVATVSDIVPRDGGRFLRFVSPEAGFKAAADLLSTRIFEGLELDRTLRKWSHNGYGAEIVSGTRLDAHSLVPSLGRDDLRVLLKAMAAAEGYRSVVVSDEVTRALQD